MSTSSDRPATAELDAALQGLGPQTADFEPGLANFVVGVILGLLGIAAGVALVGWMAHFVISRGGDLQWFGARDRHDLPWFLVGLMVFCGLAVAYFFGLEFLRTAGRVRSFRLIVCRDGFVSVEGKRVEVFRWDDLACVVEIATREYFPLKMGLKYLAPLGRSYSYAVRRKDGGQVEVDGNVVKHLGKFKKLLRAEAQRRGVEWHTEEVS
jgi:hypothetical protein